MAWPKGVPHRPEMIAKRLAKITGQKRRPHSEEGRRHMSEGRKRYLAGLPSLPRAPKRTTVSYRRDVEDFLGVRLDPRRQIVHHIIEEGGDALSNLAILPRYVHRAVHVLQNRGIAVDVSRFAVLSLDPQEVSNLV